MLVKLGFYIIKNLLEWYHGSDLSSLGDERFFYFLKVKIYTDILFLFTVEKTVNAYLDD